MARYTPAPTPFIDWKRMNTDVEYKKKTIERMVAYYTREAEYCEMMAKRKSREAVVALLTLIGMGILMGIVLGR